ncbi:hypothetical protein TOPH_07048 [Tolypocladium ophioglossoides CBS 100239]|uniref:Chromo domain-containing protein n=1 Tax=Tolypocladium ophioglossoides (strain CBS 100239) TaxID=1163406 RepID=A0A0L0N2K8_TOLOC|nr:hypothetical protein TOPH_07048 [Tolypocladium ophioglossoides CBS 100239]
MSSFFASILNSPKESPGILNLNPPRSAKTSRTKQPRNSLDRSMTSPTEATRNSRNSDAPYGVATSRNDAHHPANATEACLNDASVGISNTTSTAILAQSKPAAFDATDTLVEKEGERVGEGLEQAEEDDAEDEQVHACFKRFVQHRWAGDSIEIQVEWDKGDLTWEPEANLHEDAPETLFAYWKSKGARPTNPADPDLYCIFAIRKHSSNRKRLLVEWVGYGPKDMTWVLRRSVEKTAPEMVAQYWDSLKSKRRRRFVRRHR